MADWTWVLQGGPTTITTTDALQFAGGSFNGAITVGEYQDSMHVDQNDEGLTDSSSGSGNNVKYVSTTQGLWTTTTDAITNLTTGEATLKVTFTHGTNVSTSAGKFYAHQTTTGDVPTNVTFWAYEADGTGTWTTAESSSDVLSLDDQTTSTDTHDFYVAVSASPVTIGSKDFTVYAEVTYQ